MPDHLTPEQRAERIAEICAAIEEVLDCFSEWEFEDNGLESNHCISCGWDTRKDRTPEGPRLDHRPGCKLKAALELLYAFKSGEATIVELVERTRERDEALAKLGEAERDRDILRRAGDALVQRLSEEEIRVSFQTASAKHWAKECDAARRELAAERERLRVERERCGRLVEVAGDTIGILAQCVQPLKEGNRFSLAGDCELYAARLQIALYGPAAASAHEEPASPARTAEAGTRAGITIGGSLIEAGDYDRDGLRALVVLDSHPDITVRIPIAQGDMEELAPYWSTPIRLTIEPTRPAEAGSEELPASRGRSAFDAVSLLVEIEKKQAMEAADAQPAREVRRFEGKVFEYVDSVGIVFWRVGETDDADWFLGDTSLVGKRVRLTIEEIVAAGAEGAPAEGVTVFAVVFSNYEPAEVDSLWQLREDAEAAAKALGSDWRVVEWPVGRRKMLPVNESRVPAGAESKGGTDVP